MPHHHHKQPATVAVLGADTLVEDIPGAAPGGQRLRRQDILEVPHHRGLNRAAKACSCAVDCAYGNFLARSIAVHPRYRAVRRRLAVARPSTSA